MMPQPTAAIAMGPTATVHPSEPAADALTTPLAAANAVASETPPPPAGSPPATPLGEGVGASLAPRDTAAKRVQTSWRRRVARVHARREGGEELTSLRERIRMRKKNNRGNGNTDGEKHHGSGCGVVAPPPPEDDDDLGVGGGGAPPPPCVSLADAADAQNDPWSWAFDLSQPAPDMTKAHPSNPS